MRILCLEGSEPAVISRSSQALLEKPSEMLQVSNHTQQTSSATNHPAYLCAVKILVFFEQFICLLDCHFIIAIIKIICVRRTYTELQQAARPFGKPTSTFIAEFRAVRLVVQNPFSLHNYY